jgi:hypothetical protein
MQHFSAGLPNLAMALADMHLDRGGDDPTFVKTQVGGMYNVLHCAGCAALHAKPPWGRAAAVIPACCSQLLASRALPACLPARLPACLVCSTTSMPCCN